MPSLEVMRRVSATKNNNAKTIGQIHKENADWAIEYTWYNDPASKVCYIYDYSHDDSPNDNIGMVYDSTTKTRIDAKIILKTRGSIDKDQQELYCQFKPSQEEYFTESDELFYMEDCRKKYHLDDVFVGMYIDIPDKKMVYHKYLICAKNVEENFQKYFILPCDHKLQWITCKDGKRIKRQMWCVLRSQSSYNAGLWTDYRVTTQQNQEILFLPTNEISDTISYLTADNEKNQRIILDAPNYSIENWTPNTWIVSKVERANVKGRTKITLYQTFFDQNKDYIEYDDNGTIIGMWADYNSSSIAPIEVTDSDSDTTIVTAKVTASTQTIKVGGSYKGLTVQILDKDGSDITKDYASAVYTWSCSINNNDASDKVRWLNTSDFNKIKLKFTGDRSYLGKILHVACTIVKRRENAGKETYNCETDFELII